VFYGRKWIDTKVRACLVAATICALVILGMLWLIPQLLMINSTLLIGVVVVVFAAGVYVIYKQIAGLYVYLKNF
jgi:uncharacterized membrane protein